MLILTRRVGENLNIGDDVVVTVLGVKGNQVRLGVLAPRNMPVHREEIYQRIQRNEGSVSSGAAPERFEAAAASPASVPTQVKRSRLAVG